MRQYFHRLSENLFMIMAYPIAIAWGLYMVFSKSSVPTKNVD